MNVTATLAAAGISLEWPPITKTVQVALAAYPVAPRREPAPAGQLSLLGGEAA
jgi:hypothetical protein